MSDKKPKEVTYVQSRCNCDGQFTLLGVTPAEVVLQCQRCGEVIAASYKELANFAALNITVSPKGNGHTDKKPRLPKKKNGKRGMNGVW